MGALRLEDVQATVDALRRDMQGQIDGLKAEIAALKAARPATVAEAEIGDETLAILAATVTAYLGKKVRVRSAKLLSGSHDANPWAQHGRVFVQAASHDLRRVR